MNWEEAANSCWKNYTAHLVEIKNEEQQDFIRWVSKVPLLSAASIFVAYNDHIPRAMLSMFPDESVYGWWIGATDLNRYLLTFPHRPATIYIHKNLMQKYIPQWILGPQYFFVLIICFFTVRAPGTGPTPVSRCTTQLGRTGNLTTVAQDKTVPWSTAMKFWGKRRFGMISIAVIQEQDLETRSSQFVSGPFDKTFERKIKR